MDLYRNDRAELERLAKLQGNKATQEEVFHPQSSTTVFATAGRHRSRRSTTGRCCRFPTVPTTATRSTRRMGELAAKVGADRGLYRALRPEALATLIYMTARVRAINRGKGELTVTSTVRDQRYQDELVGVNDQATDAYSLHTTGYSFDILRKYAGDRQAEAFQFMLDRLRALDVIDYAYEPDAIHVTVSDQAKPLLDS